MTASPPASGFDAAASASAPAPAADPPTAADPTGSAPLRLALVLGSAVGGIGAHVLDLAGGFTARGARVLVAAPAATGAHFDFAAVGATFVPVDIAASPHPARDLAAVRALRRIAVGADVVHAHGVRAGALTGLAGLGGPGPRSVTRRAAPNSTGLSTTGPSTTGPDVTGLNSAAPHSPGSGRPPRASAAGRVVTLHNAMLATGLKARALTALECLAVRRADVVLGASPDLVERARRLGARDARFGPVPADPAAAPQRTRAEVRRELGLDDTATLILAVGRLAPQKDYPSLLTAAASLERATVGIAGGGPLQDALQARITAERLPVTLLGQRSDVPDLLAAADVFVLSSTWEARSLAVQEALRAGLPVVATAAGGTEELVGEAGLLVPAGDPAALAAALQQLVDQPDERARRAALGRAVAAALPGLPESLDQLSAIYAEVRRSA